MYSSAVNRIVPKIRSSLQNTVTRSFTATSTLSSSLPSPSSPLDQFRDPLSREKRFSETVGRSWSVKELRRKSFDDLHKLWFVLYKEKNMLYTESNIARRTSVYMPQKEREHKVKKSMAAIKIVLGERKRDKIAQHALKMEALAEAK
mmetsp:Transcript_17896/g.26161  ORF Transcript_17896/g.26161 Transcript_17896/m.26161 type:complete len:147 (-) Transcript_17896:157-597(-)|eukprot:CAMPEP_0197248554 /NCGR_PEP_ID=MMETSP1429-20130617/40318_1 /TAXON_ID=49237 /ORGANISM="Chaetoceros  sp., Strain UNC1202" /LENGTH=146 /DNA_ID=CAMNT_0042709813 /DNA_START=11 /DNA_END=451 /DNA_ORIENTATION=-